MSKRYQAPKEFGRNTKKPKLDYISKPCTSTIAKNINKLAFNESPNNFWDDEDDDVILLATQVAEQRQEVFADITTGDEMTFSEFGANLHAATSTQKPPTPPCSTDRKLSQLMDDSDDDAFSNLELPNEKVFKKPEALPITKQSHEQVGDSNISSRRQFAMEQQMAYQSKRMTNLLAENKKLNQELLSSKECVTSKSGEASLLRDELRHMKQQVQQLKMEKLKSREMAQSEAKSKIDQLNRTIETRETQLQMKSAECASLKMRHADENRRFDDTIRNDVSIIEQQQQQPQAQKPTTSATAAKLAAMDVDDQEEEEVIPQEIKKKLCMQISSYEDIFNIRKNIAYSNALGMHANIYIRTPDDLGCLSESRSLVRIEFEKLQLLLVQMMFNNNILDNFQELNLIERRKNPKKLIEENIKQNILNGACKVFHDFTNYVQNLEYAKPQTYYPYAEYEFERDIFTTQRSILQPTQLYVNERAVCLRRYMAALALACAHDPELALALILQRHDNGEYLLKLASDGSEQLGFSSELNDHFGILEAFAALLHVVIIQVSKTSITTIDIPEDAVQALVKLFKQIIFTRPSPWVFRELSAALYAAMIHWKNLIDIGFCYTSPTSSFRAIRNRAVYRFTPDSCILQVKI